MFIIKLILLIVLIVILVIIHKCWIYIFILYHPNTFNLIQMLYYGLTADVFDGESNYNNNNHQFNPMLSLRNCCNQIIISVSNNINNIQIKQILLKEIYPDSPSFIHNKLLQCLHYKKCNNLLIENIKNSMDKLSIFLKLNCIQKNKEKNKNKNKTKNKEKMVVIGASISGLIGILSAYHSNLVSITNIIIIEKRSSYFRDIWFDLYDEPFYFGKKLLNQQFAFNTQQTEKYIENIENMQIFIMRAQILERFFAKIVYIIGIDIKYNHILIDIEFDNKYILIIKNIKNNKKYKLKFKYLIGSDGSKSKVRQLFNISYILQNEILYKNILYKIKNLYESSLIINFKSNISKIINKIDNNFCPSLKLINNKVIDPWFINFNYDTIDAVFKRFYFNHCQLQILLNHKNKVLLNINNSNYINNLILNISNFYFKYNIKNIKEMEKMIIKNNKNNKNYNLIKNEIFLINSSLKILNDTKQIIFFIGDSAMTAHYRLGIGINTILDGFYLYYKLFKIINNNKDLIKIKNKIDIRLKNKVLYQTTIMFLESICNLLVFFNFNQTLNKNNMLLYYRDFNNYNYVKITDLNNNDLIQDCISQQVSK